jgi:hypothetical protein
MSGCACAQSVVVVPKNTANNITGNRHGAPGKAGFFGDTATA